MNALSKRDRTYYTVDDVFRKADRIMYEHKKEMQQNIVKGETQNMNLKELRAKHNLTQTALAKSVGVTSNAISAIEGGRLKLSDKLAAKIKEVYGEEPNTPVAEAEKVVAQAEAVVAEVEKAVETEVKAVAKKAHATKKKVETEAEKLADAAAEVVLETEKKPEKKTRKVKAKAQADKPAAEMVAEAVVETAKAAAAPVEAAVAEKKSRKKAPTKKKAPAAIKTSTAKKTPAAPKAPVVILQSPFGGEITAEEILSKVGEVDTVYVRIDQNKAYWVKGEETGDVDLW